MTDWLTAAADIATPVVALLRLAYEAYKDHRPKKANHSDDDQPPASAAA